MEETTKEIRLSIWQACMDLTFDYLRPKIKVSKDEFLFLYDVTERLYVFKTENGDIIMLPDTAIIRQQVKKVF